MCFTLRAHLVSRAQCHMWLVANVVDGDGAGLEKEKRSGWLGCCCHLVSYPWLPKQVSTNTCLVRHMKQLWGATISVSNFDDYCVVILTSIVRKI